jgi:hypothetical protein
MVEVLKTGGVSFLADQTPGKRGLLSILPPAR